MGTDCFLGIGSYIVWSRFTNRRVVRVGLLREGGCAADVSHHTDLCIPAFLLRGSPDRDLSFLGTNPGAITSGLPVRTKPLARRTLPRG